ncbi:hypothetical protein ACQQ2N_10530 [Dokdonella sp. MW10]|uniref:hypothetical protein n=1 Tax=Dokdonella sp. MW10 TaxID=2992926 RepID=UPI003F7E9A09
MNVKSVLGAAAIAAILGVAPAAQADTLTLEKTVVRSIDVPQRGLDMSQVERRFGAPVEKLAPVAGNKPRHPQINRWRYAGYTVYFERNRVIHSVRDGA